MDKKTITSTVSFVAGKSGGHIIPALTLAQQLVHYHADTHIIFFSTNIALDRDIIATSPHVTKHVPLELEDIPYKNFLAWPGYALRFMKALFTSMRTLKKTRTERVISMGGYISIPVCLAAKLLKIPIELIELNVKAGSATKFLAPFVATIRVCFPETKKVFSRYNCTVMDYPIRFRRAYAQLDTQKIRASLQIEPEKKVILILGGSQGSLFINKLIREWLEKDPELCNNLYIVHQVGGNDDLATWQAWYADKQIFAHVFTYHHDMALLYAVSDVVVCRSGAGTLFETIFFKKPCITIPLENVANNHQVANATTLAQHHPGRIIVIRQADAPSVFASTIASVLTTPKNKTSSENSATTR